LQKRLENLILYNSNEKLRALIYAKCAKDIVYWVNEFGWTYDPRLSGDPFIPMILYPRQEECLRFFESCEENKYDGIFEKSRDMGATWLCCFYIVHRWLFRQGFKGAIGSRKEDLLDKAGDPDCIFEKIRIIIDKLPQWMKPEGYSHQKNDKHLAIRNPANGATITGEAGDNIGRGGRNSIYFLDEAAFIDRAQKVDAALSQNTEVRIYMSTPNGNGNQFAQKRREALKKPDGPIKLFTMHWRDDPRKNKYEIHKLDGKSVVIYPWYEKQKQIIKDPVIIAQELDISYTASIEGILIPAHYVDAAIDFADWLLREKGLRMPRGIRKAGYDVADEGTADNVAVLADGPVVFGIKTWGKIDLWKSTEKIVSIGNRYKIDILNYDSVSIGSAISANLKNGDFGQTFEFNGINSGSKCTNRKWPVGDNKFKLSKDRFKNFRAENYWCLRERFEKVYEYRVLGIEHNLEDLISIPDDPTLIDQINSILCFTGEDGKMKIESKLEMKKRNVPSPDRADALAICFAIRNEITQTNITSTAHSSV